MIINLIGASGTGKTTLARMLDGEGGYNVIQSYTTRKPRYDGEWGHTFIDDCFVSYGSGGDLLYISEGLNANSKTYWKVDMIAYFNSYKSGNHYFATDDQVIKGVKNIYVVDPEGAKMVHEFYKDINVEVVTIGLVADEEIRKDRLIGRAIDNVVLKYGGIDNGDGSIEIEHLHGYIEIIEKISEEITNIILNGYPEVENRIKQDREIFKLLKCDYVLSANDELENVFTDLKDLIESI